MAKPPQGTFFPQLATKHPSLNINQSTVPTCTVLTKHSVGSEARVPHRSKEGSPGGAGERFWEGKFGQF